MPLALEQLSVRRQLLPSLRLDAGACPGFGAREDAPRRTGSTFVPVKESA